MFAKEIDMPAPSASSPSAEELERRRRLLRAFSESVRGPGTVQFEGFAPDFTIRMIGSTPLSNVMRGPEGVAANMRPFRERMAELKVIVDDVICEGDTCVKLAHSEGRMKDGRPYRNEYAHVFRFKDNLIVEVIEYLDTALIASVLRPAGQS
jgi:ketosteroid isomerase-like protein